MELINNTMNEYLENLKQKNNKVLLSTGFYNLDYAIKGLNKRELIVVASRPSMGKTSLVFNIAANVAIKKKIPVAIFSLEMSEEQCLESFIAIEAEVNINKIKTNNTNDEDRRKMGNAILKLSEARIFIDDTPAISIKELEKKCIEFRERGVELIVIDYLQLIQGNKCENICNALKEIAQNLDATIIVTSQLSRRPQERFENGESPVPKISDIDILTSKEADVLIFIHREDYYSIDSEKKNIADLIIAKNKYGDTGTVELSFMKEYLKYENLEANM